MKRSLLTSRRGQILDVAARYGARDVRLFGSLARGEETDSSDIDLLVRFEPDRSLLDHAGLVQELSELLGERVDVISEAALSGRLAQRVLREARPL